MKRMVAVFILMTAVLWAAADVNAMAGSHGKKRGGGEGFSAGDYQGSVPEPSALYAIGAGLALLGGAGWYIRRRK
jgi:hypothetical protein